MALDPNLKRSLDRQTADQATAPDLDHAGFEKNAAFFDSPGARDSEPGLPRNEPLKGMGSGQGDYQEQELGSEKEPQLVRPNSARTQSAEPNPIQPKVQPFVPDEQETCPAGPAPKAGSSDNDERFARIEELIEQIRKTQNHDEQMLTRSLRAQSEFQEQVRMGMQKELDSFKAQQAGEVFNDILRQIAEIYVNYQMIFDEKDIPDKTQNNLRSLFSDLEDIMEDYNVEVQCTPAGAPRPTKSTKIIHKILVADETKHNHVACSRRPGVVRGKKVLIQEFVDAYIYDPNVASDPEQGQPTDEQAENKMESSGEMEASGAAQKEMDESSAAQGNPEGV